VELTRSTGDTVASTLGTGRYSVAIQLPQQQLPRNVKTGLSQDFQKVNGLVYFQYCYIERILNSWLTVRTDHKELQPTV